MNNKSLIKKLVEAFDFGKLKPKNQSVQQSTMQQSLQRMNDYNKNVRPEIEKTVDLGLPSGTLWCKFNVGAKNETEIESGDYFAWGETEPKDEYSWETYKFGPKDKLTKYNKVDKLIQLLPEDDAATVNMGKYWRMPTEDQFQELNDETNNEWVKNYKGSGVNGMLFTSKTNGNTLFIPSMGYIEMTRHNNYNLSGNVWGVSLNSTNNLLYPLNGYDMTFTFFSNGCIYVSNAGRYYGQSVRAVFNG